VVKTLPEGLEHGTIGENTLVHFEGTPLQRADDNIDYEAVA
jgi:hypothetical protein